MQLMSSFYTYLVNWCAVTSYDRVCVFVPQDHQFSLTLTSPRTSWKGCGYQSLVQWWVVTSPPHYDGLWLVGALFLEMPLLGRAILSTSVIWYSQTFVESTQELTLAQHPTRQLQPVSRRPWELEVNTASRCSFVTSASWNTHYTKPHNNALNHTTQQRTKPYHTTTH